MGLPCWHSLFLLFFVRGREIQGQCDQSITRLLTYRDHQSWVFHVGSPDNVACLLKASLWHFCLRSTGAKLVGVCLPPEIRPAEYLKLTGYMVGSLFIRGHSAGSYAGMVWETILAEFPDIEGKTVLAAIALPPSLLTTPRLSHKRQVHLIHHADDRLCVWTRPTRT